ncbi:hypothetical protein [Rhodovulum sp. YEN HP10]
MRARASPPAGAVSVGAARPNMIEPGTAAISIASGRKQVTILH